MNTLEIENALINLEQAECLLVISTVLEKLGLKETYIAEQMENVILKNETYILSEAVLAKDWNSEADKCWDNYNENDSETF